MTKLLTQCPVIKEMLIDRSATTLAAERIPVHSDIGTGHAEALYEAVLRERPTTVLEVGMAFGVSSLAILTALRDIGENGRLVSIDPNQTTYWKGCGLAAVERAGLKSRHELFEDFDYNVLPRLLASGLKLEFAYIDGWHTFDYTLVDWWYVDKMLAAGGIAVFNDCSWPAVAKAINFVLTHRKYTEIDSGIPAPRRRKEALLRLLSLGMKKRPLDGRDRYLKKQESWEPKWDFFVEF